MPVEVASGAVVVLGGAWVGVTGEDLCITEWDARIQGSARPFSDSHGLSLGGVTHSSPVREA